MADNFTLSCAHCPEIIIIIIINILTAIGLAPGGSSPVHIYREHYIEYTNNTQNTYVHRITK